MTSRQKRKVRGLKEPAGEAREPRAETEPFGRFWGKVLLGLTYVGVVVLLLLAVALVIIVAVIVLEFIGYVRI